jgi:hypothetical protein
MLKEYGKLTAAQFKSLIDFLPEIRRQGEDLRTVVRSVPKARLDELLVADYNWGSIYELSFHEHLAVVAYSLNLAGYLHDLRREPDPQRANRQASALLLHASRRADSLGTDQHRQMVDRYAKFATENLLAAASRIERGVTANVVELSRSRHAHQTTTA